MRQNSLSRIRIQAAIIRAVWETMQRTEVCDWLESDDWSRFSCWTGTEPLTREDTLKPGHSLRGGAPFIPGDKKTLMFLVVGAHRDFNRLSQLTSSLASAYLEWGWNNLLMPLFYTFQILLDLMDQILSVKRVISRRWWHLFHNVSLWGKVFCVCM